MNYKLIQRAIGGLVFLISLLQLALTVQPSVSFWDCGEWSAAAVALQVPHPPGTPLFTLMGRFFSMMPLNINTGLKINWISVLVSSFSVLLLYLSAIKLIENFNEKDSQNSFYKITTYAAAAIGALAFTFSDTFWFNGVEAGVYAPSTLLLALITWLILLWNERPDDKTSEKYLLMIALLLGLTPGIHLMSVLTAVSVVMIIMFRKYVQDDEACKQTGYLFLVHFAIILIIAFIMWGNQTTATPPSPEEYRSFDNKFKMIMLIVSAIYMGIFWRKIFNRNSFYLPLIFGAIALFVIFPGMVRLLPQFISMVSGDDSYVGLAVFLIIIIALGFVVRYTTRENKPTLHLVFMSLIFSLFAFSIYFMTIIRANQDPPMNENDPKDINTLVTYLNREQYGDFPIFERRFTTESYQQGVYTNYSSDLDFWWKYQMNHMMTRYILWSFAGREGWNQDQGVDMGFLNGIMNATIGKIFNIDFGASPKDGAATYWGIPFLIGLFGIYFHFKKDWKMASAFMIMFVLMGYLTAFYQNQQESQPRERDYFYMGAYFVFSIWIALGVKGLIDIVQESIKSQSASRIASASVILLAIVFIPVRMASQNWFTHDRSRNWVPWDYAYNLLQSCAPNAVLFTNGDNDTFPLWYLQDVEGVRRDIRIANLSLLNTSWYIKQLKDTEPYGAKKVLMNYTDAQIDMLEPVQWRTRTVNLPVPKDVLDRLKMDYKGSEVTASKSFIEEYGNIDSSSIRTGMISFKVAPTLSFGNVQAVRVQDLMVKDIVEACKWERPIYFAVTCSEDSKIGLQDYLIDEGLAQRLIPFKSKGGGDFFINEVVMKQQLFDINQGYSKDYKPGFKFRGLNDSTIFFDENNQRLTMNYRSAFMGLALFYLYQDKNNPMVIKTLNAMNYRVPESIFKMPERLEANIAGIYLAAGDTAKYKAMASSIEAYALNRLKTDPYDATGNQTLIELYTNTKEYNKVLNVLTKLEQAFPNDPSIKSAIQKYKALSNQKDSNLSK